MGQKGHEPAQKRQDGGDNGRRRPLERARFTHVEEFAHQQAEVERGDLDQGTLAYVEVTSHMRSAQATGVERVRKGPLQNFAAASHERLAAAASLAAAVCVDGISRVFFPDPVLAPSVGLRDVRSPTGRPQCKQHGLAVVALVRHCFFGLFGLLRIVARLLLRRGQIRRRGFPVSPRSSTCRLRRRLRQSPRPQLQCPCPTACSCLCARCVRPSFIFMIWASGSYGFFQSPFEPFFFRFRSIRARSSRVGVAIPDASAKSSRNAL